MSMKVKQLNKFLIAFDKSNTGDTRGKHLIEIKNSIGTADDDQLITLYDMAVRADNFTVKKMIEHEYYGRRK